MPRTTINPADYAPFHAAIEAAPDDALPKLMFADWLEERGEERAAQRWRERATAPVLRRNWEYCGDIDLKYGGSFIDLSDWEYGYCNAVRVDDLDSACGFTGAVMIEHRVINGVDDAQRIRQALQSCGGFSHYDQPRGPEVLPSDRKKHLRHHIADALLSYGHSDPDDGWGNYRSHHSEVVQLEPDGPMSFDGWRADKRLNNTDLRAYVESVHLR